MAAKRRRSRSGSGRRRDRHGEQSFPKTTRPRAGAQREQELVPSTVEAIGRKFDAQPARIDISGLVLPPDPYAAVDRVVNCDLVPPSWIKGARELVRATHKFESR